MQLFDIFQFHYTSENHLHIQSIQWPVAGSVPIDGIGDAWTMTGSVRMYS